MENTVTNNLEWTIERFGKQEKSFITFPTKFSATSKLLNLEHKGRTIIRMSVNPEFIISTIELGTSSLNDRINSINELCTAGYRIGLLIAPVIFIEDWKKHYIQLLDVLSDKLCEKVKHEMSIEIIFMTYSFIHRAINSEAFPEAVELYDKDKMTGRGMGKYTYNNETRREGEEFFNTEITRRFGEGKIAYIV